MNVQKNEVNINELYGNEFFKKWFDKTTIIVSLYLTIC